MCCKTQIRRGYSNKYLYYSAKNERANLQNEVLNIKIKPTLIFYANFFAKAKLYLL